MELRGAVTLTICGALVFSVALPHSAQAAERVEKLDRGPLATYVNKADESYGWKIVRSGKLGGAEYAELRLTSQMWRKAPWKHQLFLIKPSKLGPAPWTGLLYIGGGAWRAQLDTDARPGVLPASALVFAALAEDLQSPIAVLLQVPQQPLLGDLYEDALIARTMADFLKSGNPEDLLLLPMAKSAVRAMDAIQEFSQQEWKGETTGFTVTGASKRGWTTWLSGAVDPRVKAMAPMVIDMVNLPKQLKHQIDSWGAFSEQIEDYTALNLPKYLATPRGQEMVSIVDPHAYVAALTQPKLIINGTNDPYWPLDSLGLYWKDLPGPKNVLYLPNNGHGLTDMERVAAGISALHRQAAGKDPLPSIDWKLAATDAGQSMQLTFSTDPARVNIWEASSATRDFRRSTWTKTAFDKGAQGYTISTDRPQTGYKAFLAEAEFPGKSFPLRLSSCVEIIKASD